MSKTLIFPYCLKYIVPHIVRHLFINLRNDVEHVLCMYIQTKPLCITVYELAKIEGFTRGVHLIGSVEK